MRAHHGHAGRISRGRHGHATRSPRTRTHCPRGLPHVTLHRQGPETQHSPSLPTLPPTPGLPSPSHPPQYHLVSLSKEGVTQVVEGMTDLDDVAHSVLKRRSVVGVSVSVGEVGGSSAHPVMSRRRACSHSASSCFALFNSPVGARLSSAGQSLDCPVIRKLVIPWC